MVVKRNGSGQGSKDFFRDFLGIVDGLDFMQDHDEFIAPKTGDRIDRAHRFT